MRIFFKILAAPIVVVLTLVVAFLSFLLFFSSMVLGIASGLVFLASLIFLAYKEYFNFGCVLVLAFLISPFGLPLLAGLIINGLKMLNGALKNFIVS